MKKPFEITVDPSIRKLKISVDPAAKLVAMPTTPFMRRKTKNTKAGRREKK